MNIEQDLKRYICVCKCIILVRPFWNITFFLMFQDMNCGAQTCLFTCCCWQSILDRVSTAEPFFLRIRRRGTVQNDRQSAWNSSIWKQMESRLLPKTNKSSVMEFSSFAIGMGAKIFYEKKWFYLEIVYDTQRT